MAIDDRGVASPVREEEVGQLIVAVVDGRDESGAADIVNIGRMIARKREEVLSQ